MGTRHFHRIECRLNVSTDVGASLDFIECLKYLDAFSRYASLGQEVAEMNDLGLQRLRTDSSTFHR